MDIDHSIIGHPSLPGMESRPHIAHRHASKCDRLVEVLFTRAMHGEQAYRLYKQLTEGQDSPEVQSAVDRYQSALLMPKWLMVEADEHYDLTKWPELYRLADEAQVNISNLTVRLQRLGLIYVHDGDKTIYRSRDDFTGQMALF